MSFLKTRKPVMINFTVTGVGNDVTCEKTVDEILKICKRYKNVIAQVDRSINGERALMYLPLTTYGESAEMEMAMFSTIIVDDGQALMVAKQGADGLFNYIASKYSVME